MWPHFENQIRIRPKHPDPQPCSGLNLKRVPNSVLICNFVKSKPYSSAVNIQYTLYMFVFSLRKCKLFLCIFKGKKKTLRMAWKFIFYKIFNCIHTASEVNILIKCGSWKMNIHHTPKIWSTTILLFRDLPISLKCVFIKTDH